MFLLQCTGRSGSTYLRSLLMSNCQLRISPSILTPNTSARMFYHFWAEEVRRDPNWLSPERRTALVQKFFRSRQSNDERKYGTDLKLEQLDVIPWAADAIYGPADRVIILKRMNVLKQVVSYELMMSRLKDSAEPVHSGSVPKARAVYIDPAFALANMRERVGLVRAYQAKVIARKKPYVVVVYEDLAGSGCVDLLEDLQRFLGVKPVRLSSELVKQNPQPLSALIGNYEEVARAVKESEFAYSLYLPT